MSKALAIQIEQVAVNDVLPHARNSRVHEEWQVAQIAASIKEFGFLAPILIDADGTIIAGHGRVMAALRLDLETVPAIRATHLTEAQKRAYIIADNKLAENAKWDKDMLKIELGDLRSAGFDINLTGFGKLELDDLLGSKDGLDLGGLGGGEPGITNSGQSGLNPPASHVRMVQLFLDDTSQPAFLERCEKLQEVYGTETLTDTVLEAVKRSAEAAE